MNKIFTLCALFVSGLVIAQGYTPDATFGTNGKTVTSFGIPAANYAYAGAQHGNGFVVAGDLGSNDISGFTAGIARFLPNGALDTSFGQNGRAVFALLPPFREVAVTPDLKILALGSTRTAAFTLIRTTPNGNIDTSFGINGKYQFLPMASDGYYSSTEVGMVLDGSGNVFIAGTLRNNDHVPVGFITKIDANGNLATSFGDQGYRIFSFANNDSAILTDLALTPEGTIVVSGNRIDQTYNSSPFVLRLTQNGVADTTFGDAGCKFLEPLGNLQATINAIGLSGDKVVLAATVKNTSTSQSDLGVIRLLADGSYDTTFSGDGLSTFENANRNEAANDLAVFPDGRIGVVGTMLETMPDADVAYSDLFLGFLFAADGASTSLQQYTFPDESQGNAAIAFTPLSGTPYLITVATSQRRFFATSVSPEMAVPNNDLTFSSDFACQVSKFGNNYTITGLAEGRFGLNTTVAKYDVTGQTALIKTLPNYGNDHYSSAHQVLSNGKLLVGTGYQLYRLLEDGQQDTFGSSGKLTLPQHSTAIKGIKTFSDGRILLMCSHYASVPGGIVRSGKLYCANVNGTLLAAFGNGTAATETVLDAEFNDMALQSDEKILVSGFYNYGDYFLIRYNANGTLDTTFANQGFYTTAGDMIQSVGNRIAIQPDGKILATFGQKLVRLNYDGSLDVTFNNTGEILGAYGKIALRPNGRIVTGIGGFKQYYESGQQDLGFGVNGVVTLEAGTFQFVNDWILDGEKIVLCGRTDYPYNHTAIMRILPGQNLGIIDFTTNETMLYPNPVEYRTTFRYELPNAAKVTVALYDLSGKVVANYLSDKSQDSGVHELQIDMPAGLASGHYLLKISSATGSNTIKLLKK